MSTKTFIESLLELADIKINGNQPWDIQVHSDKLYDRVIHTGTLGLGESYVEGWWDCEQLDVMFYKCIRAKLEQKLKQKYPALLITAKHILFNLQNPYRATMVAELHYNCSNQLFECMLGKSMTYSCGYWQNATDLYQAQQNKMDLICKKLKLETGMKILDIGCGWGALADYMSRCYKVSVCAVTVSSEQLNYAQEHYASPLIDFRLEDYREHVGKYDRIVSVGMFEHVGYKNYSEYFAETKDLLDDNGLFLLHTIGSNVNKMGCDPWVNKYIFPNGMLPSLSHLGKKLSDYYIMEDWHNFGADYDKTLMAWDKRFTECRLANKFECDEEKQRMFHYYLTSCAGAFRARDLQLWQLVLSPSGVEGGYCCR